MLLYAVAFVRRQGISMPNTVILIADDEPWQRMWIARVLHGAGFTCVTVADGAEVVEQALAIEPALVLLDVRMPGSDGFTTAEQLRILPNTRHIPILFMTAFLSTQEMAAYDSLSGTAWLVKPFDPDELLQRIAQMLGLV
jgi:two-component system, chemotaxis family, chemotaxis protein CheY